MLIVVAFVPPIVIAPAAAVSNVAPLTVPKKLTLCPGLPTEIVVAFDAPIAMVVSVAVSIELNATCDNVTNMEGRPMVMPFVFVAPMVMAAEVEVSIAVVLTIPDTFTFAPAFNVLVTLTTPPALIVPGKLTVCAPFPIVTVEVFEVPMPIVPPTLSELMLNTFRVGVLTAVEKLPFGPFTKDAACTVSQVHTFPSHKFQKRILVVPRSVKLFVLPVMLAYPEGAMPNINVFA
jgi:hypothetical protein